MKPLIILENIRSAYNVGNIIRTADALGYNVVLSGFTPHPDTKKQVKKSSLGAESSVDLRHFWNPVEAIAYIRTIGYALVVGEISHASVPLSAVDIDAKQPLALLVGNENTGVLQESLRSADIITHIPMSGIKESLNVGQAAAILMWTLK